MPSSRGRHQYLGLVIALPRIERDTEINRLSRLGGAVSSHADSSPFFHATPNLDLRMGGRIGVNWSENWSELEWPRINAGDDSADIIDCRGWSKEPECAPAVS